MNPIGLSNEPFNITQITLIALLFLFGLTFCFYGYGALFGLCVITEILSALSVSTLGSVILEFACIAIGSLLVLATSAKACSLFFKDSCYEPEVPFTLVSKPDYANLSRPPYGKVMTDVSYNLLSSDLSSQVLPQNIEQDVKSFGIR